MDLGLPEGSLDRFNLLAHRGQELEVSLHLPAQNHHVGALREALERFDPVEELLLRDGPVAVVKQLEDHRRLGRVHLESAEPRPHAGIRLDLVKLLLRDQTVARLVQDLEELLDVLGHGLCGLLLLPDHDVLVTRRHLEGLLDERADDHLDHGEADGELVAQQEEGPPLVHVVHETSERWPPVREGDLEHCDHGPCVGAPLLVQHLAATQVFLRIHDDRLQDRADRHRDQGDDNDHEKQRPAQHTGARLDGLDQQHERV
mmetsp:Transcript_10342/g.22781  ORF Transcript_10342/g.22781 Transcript_10342/m.22781 type:complete len:259 (+) Transcript_10342:310-1086(+)